MERGQRYTTLVIVDMQRGYCNSMSNGELIDKIAEIKKDIQRQIENKHPIVLVEFWSDGKHQPCWTGRTLPDILDAVGQYENAVLVPKHHMDGGVEVLEMMKARSWDVELSTFRLCGVYTNQCVAATAFTLARLLPYNEVQFHLPACYPELPLEEFIHPTIQSEQQNIKQTPESFLYFQQKQQQRQQLMAC